MRASIVLHVMLVASVLACAETPPAASPSAPASEAKSTERHEESTAIAPRAPCLAAAPSPLPASHNPGTNCITAGCHDGSEPKAPRWTVAGTLYVDATGSAPASGATIEVTDASGHTLTLPTALGGSFHTADAVTQPLKVRASRCPNDAPMLGKVFRVESCNMSNCHTAAMRMHLP